jgi:signal transduction histidine kinase
MTKKTTTEEFLNPNLQVSPELSQRAYLNILEDMQAQKTVLEDQRKATFNILEDIAESQNELQLKYRHTQVLRNLLQKLTLSVEPMEVMESTLHAFEDLLNFDVASFVINDNKEKSATSNIYIYAKTLVGRSYMEAARRKFLKFIESMPSGVKNATRLEQQLRGRLFYEFVKGSMQIEETLGRMPVRDFFVPLMLKESSTLIGVFHIASVSHGPNYSQNQIEIASDIARIVSFNIERINTMIRSEYARMSNLVDSMTNGVIVFNQARIVTLANPVVEQMTGLPCSSSSSSSSSSMFPLDEFTRLFSDIDFNPVIRQVLEYGVPFHLEETKLLRSFYEMFISPIYDHEKKIGGAAIIIHDVTHLKEIDRMKTEFVSIASHQLRTPLTAIKLFSEMLSNQAGELSADARSHVSDIQASTTRMIKLVNDLLNVSRLETGRLKIDPEPVDLVEFIEGVIQEAQDVAAAAAAAAAASCNIQFVKPKETLPTFLIDRSLMRQVIHNLLMNAIRYSPKQECNVEVTLKKQDQDMLIAVKDEGIGIAKDQQSQIFNKFFRTDEAVKIAAEGSGLGMYVSKMVVEASGGKIWFESEQGKGTTFFVSLPVEGMKKKEGEKGLA